MRGARRKSIELNAGFCEATEKRRMRKLSRIAAGALLAGALAAPALAEDGVTDTEIILGSHTALSGPVAGWGEHATKGAQMYYDEVNEKGGVHGRKIKLIVEDH